MDDVQIVRHLHEVGIALLRHCDELLVALLRAHLLAHLGVDGLGHLHGLLQDCKLIFHVNAVRALDISLNIGDGRLAFDVRTRDRAQVHLDVGPVLGFIGAQLFGFEAAERPTDLGLLTRRHEELEPRRQPRELAGDDCKQWLLRLLGQLVERVEDDEQRPLGHLHLRDEQRRLEERLEELRGVVHRFPWHTRGLKLLLVAREPMREHSGQAAEQRAGRRLRRVVVAAKVPGDGTVDDTV
eukprot:jgi/Chrpa1/25374/Chrysochromulina_OHIO_Genome00006637-RA